MCKWVDCVIGVLNTTHLCCCSCRCARTQPSHWSLSAATNCRHPCPTSPFCATGCIRQCMYNHQKCKWQATQLYMQHVLQLAPTVAWTSFIMRAIVAACFAHVSNLVCCYQTVGSVIFTRWSAAATNIPHQHNAFSMQFLLSQLDGDDDDQLQVVWQVSPLPTNAAKAPTGHTCKVVVLELFALCYRPVDMCIVPSGVQLSCRHASSLMYGACLAVGTLPVSQTPA